MFDKFNVYDLFGYVIPGAIVVLALYWVGTTGLGLALPPLGSDLASSFVFLGVSYLAGHLIQAFGEWWEGRLCNREGGRLSERLLLPANAPHWVDKHGFSTEFKNRIIGHGTTVFGVPDPGGAPDPGTAKTWRQELFNLCYALVVQEDAAQHTEVFLAINGLSRGVYMASVVGFLASGVIVGKQVVWELSHQAGGPWTGDFRMFWLGVLGVVGSFVTGWLARTIFMRFRAYFAESVYYGFEAWFGKKPWPRTF
jgi:hypothetical protein